MGMPKTKKEESLEKRVESLEAELSEMQGAIRRIAAEQTQALVFLSQLNEKNADLETEMTRVKNKAEVTNRTAGVNRYE